MVCESKKSYAIGIEDPGGPKALVVVRRTMLERRGGKGLG